MLAAKAVVIGAVAFVIGALAAAVAIPLGMHVLNSERQLRLPRQRSHPRAHHRRHRSPGRPHRGRGARSRHHPAQQRRRRHRRHRRVHPAGRPRAGHSRPRRLRRRHDVAVPTHPCRRLLRPRGASPDPRSSTTPYTLANGYYPLAPWAGLAVLCAYASPPSPWPHTCSAAETHDRRTARRVDQAAHPRRHRLAAHRRCHPRPSRSAPRSPPPPTSPSGSGGGQDPTKLALAGIYLGQVVIAVLAVLAISEEYGTGMIRRHPRRHAAPPRPPRRQSRQRRRAHPGRRGPRRRRLPPRRAPHAPRPPGFDPAHGYALVSISHGRRCAPPPAASSTSSSSPCSASASPPPSATPPYRSAPCSACSTCPPSSPRRRRPAPTTPQADRPDDRRARHPSHHQPALPAHRPLGRPRRPRRMGSRVSPSRRGPAPTPRRMNVDRFAASPRTDVTISRCPNDRRSIPPPMPARARKRTSCVNPRVR